MDGSSVDVNELAVGVQIALQNGGLTGIFGTVLV